ncbi:glycoside hydrolase family 92 protein [Flagelloscypha sp. PMI_526]|nr:glycoside hydrolase family 92 protein [Flagelloscypha sp. PMI_526]
MIFIRQRWPAALFVFSAGAFARAPIPASFSEPACEQFDYINPLIGNGGDTPNGSGGMIPSTAPPFGMTRWVAQTHENYVSKTPYNYTANSIHGFQATHQPAIWMGESANLAVIPGSGKNPVVDFAKRGMVFVNQDEEVLSPSYYSAELALPEGGKVFAEQSATSRVGHLRFTFSKDTSPYIIIEASRPSVITSTPTNITYPNGTIEVDPARKEICGTNSEIQDFIIAPVSIREAVSNFKGYFCARFDVDFIDFGIIQNGTTHYGETKFPQSPLLSAYAHFNSGAVVNVRVGVSFISIEQARNNLDREIPDGQSLEETAKSTRTAWVEKMKRVKVEGGSDADKEVFYTAVFHSFQYPYEQDEYGRYFSAYDGQVHVGTSYTGYSIWDTYRAEWAWQILMVPERVPDMITSMLQDYKEGGWLPMWKNIFETNIMVGTHADSLVAEAVVKGITGFDRDLAWEAVYKDATVPPLNDHNTVYDDREENVDFEVRAGLSSVYADQGWVADDIHSESASRTLDYAYDDYCVAMLAKALGKDSETVDFFLNRSLTAPLKIFNTHTGFMEARNANGEWAGEDNGWTEGDKWAYSFDIIHDVDALIKARGGPSKFVQSLDDHFNGGHNDHTNEPSHHIPYLYALAGAASKGQEIIRAIAASDYNNTARGLSGNEDCGQMSAWYIFSAMGWYPVNPVSKEYVIGSPLFDKITLDLPSGKPLIITSYGASSTKPYVQSVKVNGEKLAEPIIHHDHFATGGRIEFVMQEEPAAWNNDLVVRSEDIQSTEQMVLEIVVPSS